MRIRSGVELDSEFLLWLPWYEELHGVGFTYSSCGTARVKVVHPVRGWVSLKCLASKKGYTYRTLAPLFGQPSTRPPVPGQAGVPEHETAKAPPPPPKFAGKMKFLCLHGSGACTKSFQVQLKAVEEALGAECVFDHLDGKIKANPRTNPEAAVMKQFFPDDDNFQCVRHYLGR